MTNLLLSEEQKVARMELLAIRTKRVQPFLPAAVHKILLDEEVRLCRELFGEEG